MLKVKTGELIHVVRERSSRNGNPRYRAIVDGVEFWTGVDSAHAYKLPNYRDKRVTVELKEVRGRLTLASIKEVGQ